MATFHWGSGMRTFVSAELVSLALRAFASNGGVGRKGAKTAEPPAAQPIGVRGAASAFRGAKASKGLNMVNQGGEFSKEQLNIGNLTAANQRGSQHVKNRKIRSKHIGGE